MNAYTRDRYIERTKRPNDADRRENESCVTKNPNRLYTYKCEKNMLYLHKCEKMKIPLRVFQLISPSAHWFSH